MKEKCDICGGWGLGVVQEHGMCNHCFRTAYSAEAKPKQVKSEVIIPESLKVTEEVKEVEKKPEPLAIKNKSVADRLLKLQLLRNKALHANKKAVLEEEKQILNKKSNRKRTREFLEEHKKEFDKELSQRGLTEDDADILKTSWESENKRSKREQKQKNKIRAVGWDMFNEDTYIKSLNKRSAVLPTKPGDGYKSGVTEEGKERMVQELLRHEQKTKNFSRRRQDYEERDVDYINRRNDRFNRRLEKEFGKYTKDIKANLERGTAL